MTVKMSNPVIINGKTLATPSFICPASISKIAGSVSQVIINPTMADGAFGTVKSAIVSIELYDANGKKLMSMELIQ